MKPMLFNTEMVRAILDRRKTVTRRVVLGINNTADFLELSENPSVIAVSKTGKEYPKDVEGLYADFVQDGNPEYPLVKAPYRPGDILYVRETFFKDNADKYHYKADYDAPPVFEKDIGHGLGWAFVRWRPSIHMPKEAARLFLRVKAVRVERLHDMTANSAMDEGFIDWNDFVRCWDSTIKPADRALYGWAANPWVWVIDFERITKEEAE